MPENMPTDKSNPTSVMIDWKDFPKLGWEKTECLQYEFCKEGVELTLLEPDLSGDSEIMVQFVTTRTMARRRVRFQLPASPSDYNSAIETIEDWHNVSLAEIKWEQPSLQNKESDEESDEDEDPRLRFLPGHAELIKGKLEEAVYAAMKSRKLSSEEMMQMGAFLWLVERLPVHREEYTGKIELSYDHGEGAGWTMVTISEEGLALDKGEIFRGAWGSDHESKTVYRVTTIGGSDFDPDFYLEEWLREFVGDAGDQDVKISIEWFPEEEMPRAGL